MRRCLMVGLLLTLLLPAAARETRTVRRAPAWPVFKGAWFRISYPPGFRPRPSLRSRTGVGYDSAFFTARDGRVVFYVYSPQWSGSPTDIALSPRIERLVSRKQTRENGGVTTWLTYIARNGSYTRSVMIQSDASTVRAFGIRYAGAKHYATHKADYDRFRKSLVQFAD